MSSGTSVHRAVGYDTVFRPYRRRREGEKEGKEERRGEQPPLPPARQKREDKEERRGESYTR